MSPAPTSPVPRPALTFVVCLLAVVLVFNIVWDATQTAYSGERVTFFLGVVVFAMLGYDVTKLYRRNGGPDA